MPIGVGGQGARKRTGGPGMLAVPGDRFLRTRPFRTPKISTRHAKIGGTFNVEQNYLCPGGGHVHLNIDVCGYSVLVHVSLDELRVPLTEAERDAAAVIVLRMRLNGMSEAQAKAELSGGVALWI